jgi:hypothetical protein
MPKKLIGLAALFTAGLLLAGGLTAVGAADVTTTETVQGGAVTTTVELTETEPGTTVSTTVEQTTTRTIVPTTSTSASSSSSNSTPTWVWVVLAILAAAVIGLLVAVFARRGISDEERQRRLEAAVASWAAQGWALENQTPGSAILRRGPEVMVVSIDDKGQVGTRPVANS